MLCLAYFKRYSLEYKKMVVKVDQVNIPVQAAIHYHNEEWSPGQKLKVRGWS